jgi:hypothetical protein
MATPTVADAFAGVTPSADKTAIIAAANSMVTAIQGAVTSGTFTARVGAVLQDTFVQFCQAEIAENMPG